MLFRLIDNWAGLGNQFMQSNTPWVLVKGNEEERYMSWALIDNWAGLGLLFHLIDKCAGLGVVGLD